MAEEDRCYFLDERYECRLRKFKLGSLRSLCVAARLVSSNLDLVEQMEFIPAAAEAKCLCYTTDESLGKQLENMFKGTPPEEPKR